MDSKIRMYDLDETVYQAVYESVDWALSQMTQEQIAEMSWTQQATSEELGLNQAA